MVLLPFLCWINKIHTLRQKKSYCLLSNERIQFRLNLQVILRDPWSVSSVCAYVKWRFKRLPVWSETVVRLEEGMANHFVIKITPHKVDFVYLWGQSVDGEVRTEEMPLGLHVFPPMFGKATLGVILIAKITCREMINHPLPPCVPSTIKCAALTLSLHFTLKNYIKNWVIVHRSHSLVSDVVWALVPYVKSALTNGFHCKSWRPAPNLKHINNFKFLEEDLNMMLFCEVKHFGFSICFARRFLC